MPFCTGSVVYIAIEVFKTETGVQTVAVRYCHETIEKDDLLLAARNRTITTLVLPCK